MGPSRWTRISRPSRGAAVAALSVSGLPTDTFLFLGFPPRKPAKRIAFLQGLAEENRTLIFYESPKRLAGLLSDLSDIVGERRAVLSREMTKPFEEFIRGTLSDIHGAIQRKKALKGECTLLVEGKKKSEDVSQKALREIVVGEFDAGETGVSALSKKIAERYGISKKKVYEEVIRMKKERGEAG